MATNESIMTLPLASKFKAEARAMADRGLSTYEAIHRLNKLEQQDKPRADAIMALHESDDYQPLLRAMANVPCIDVGTAKSILSMTIEQERPKVAPQLTSAFENFMDMHSPKAVSAGIAYDGTNPCDDGDIDRILKTI
ncbi:phage head-tail connector protein [Escherichia coli]|uniref:phage head-tail connector protein n=1 Tax=Escherichia coli TaxID=562 RepID=UPI000CDE21EF|nr:phage head-tail connector protein [Escherichia coli]POS51615.1 phage head-tail connector protein [Escherichia coli]HCN8576371.1 phage head-tail connector protein [Escherichia coli]HCN9141393.1 phage head-tail connector protein [Escherichia coli]